MRHDEIEWYLKDIVECVDFDRPKDRHYSTAPCGEPYVVCKFEAAKSLFDDPEDVLCRMFLSRVIEEKRWIETWETDTNGTPFKGDIKLYWRVKPEIEDNGEGMVKFYARYLVVGEGKKGINNAQR